jgi:tetratricopeptide (TPR) repeat protein
MPPESPEAFLAPWFLIAWGIFYLLAFAFWLWMFIDCYLRLGLNAWHYLFFFVPPSTLVYFILNVRRVFRGPSGRGFFGGGPQARIKRAEQQLRVADTLAVRFELAEAYFEAARYAESETYFRDVLAADPESNEAAYYLGLCRLQQNDAAGALVFLEQVVNRDRKIRFGLAWLRYTDALLAVGRRAEALEERRKLARAYPRPLTEFAFARLLADTGEKEKAHAVLDDMLATSHDAPAEDGVWLSHGKALLRELA